ncbi:hypothetical protein DFS33DRAFT_1327352 [Desarmillaria ectypa]|nr:hypothetical protein DFS33DRAFT_1327352 [Desarmillaria ectypa]
MPLIRTLEIFRQKVQDKNVAASAGGANMVEKILSQALIALDMASNKGVKDGAVIAKAYDEAVTAILSFNWDILQLGDIRKCMENARNKDGEVQSKKSSILTRHLKPSKGSAPDKSPRVKVDIRVREDINYEKSQKSILVDEFRETDTLDTVLLLMVLKKGPTLQDNPHFYDRHLLDDLLDVKNLHRSALPFDSVLQDIPRSDYLVLYCLRDHGSRNFLLLRSVDTQRSFANIWQVDMKKFILKSQHFCFSIRNTLFKCFSLETIGDLRSADWIIRYGLIADIKIVKKSERLNSEGSEMRKYTWLELFQEVYEAFKQEGDMYWTIEVESSQPIPPKFISQGCHDLLSIVSLTTISSGTSTLVPTVPASAAEPDKERRDTKHALFSIWEIMKRVALDLVQPVRGP